MTYIYVYIEALGHTQFLIGIIIKCLLCVKAYLRNDKNLLTVMSNNNFNLDLHNEPW